MAARDGRKVEQVFREGHRATVEVDAKLTIKDQNWAGKVGRHLILGLMVRLGVHSIMNRIYRYILVHDHGIAPCPADGLVTLGTCKPMYWVLGFRRGSLELGMLLWGGRVKEIAPHGEYERLYRGRPDALYRERPNGTFDRVDPAGGLAAAL